MSWSRASSTISTYSGSVSRYSRRTKRRRPFSGRSGLRPSICSCRGWLYLPIASRHMLSERRHPRKIRCCCIEVLALV
jgi:hypothetical protein